MSVETILYNNTNIKTLAKARDEFVNEFFRPVCSIVPKGIAKSYFCDEYIKFVNKNFDQIASFLNFDLDYLFSYEACRVLHSTYLVITDEWYETPQHMWLRVSWFVSGGDVDIVEAKYKMFSKLRCIHGTPTLINAALAKQANASSCYLFTIADDIVDMADKYKAIAMIARNCGGIGLSMSEIRQRGANIALREKSCKGTLPNARIIDSILSYVDQGGRRNATATLYIEMWHPDLMDLISLRSSKQGHVPTKSNFYAIFMCDLFMRRLETDPESTWYFFDPREGLSDLYGIEFERSYEMLVKTGKKIGGMKVSHIWTEILKLQTETGSPFILYKDQINRCSMEGMGVIKTGNLCTEIVQFSSPKILSVCTLASISLPACLDDKNEFCFDRFQNTIRFCVHNLNHVLHSENFAAFGFPDNSTNHTRPIGIGLQGMAKMFQLMEIEYTSEQAKALNLEIFECLYFTAIEESSHLVRIYGKFPNFENSPYAKGKLHIDFYPNRKTSGKYDFDLLARRVRCNGIANALVVAQMPTASSSSILANSDSIFPLNANLIRRQRNCGDITILNEVLESKLRQNFGDEVCENVLKHIFSSSDGSIQTLEYLPITFRKIFKNRDEYKESDLIDQYSDIFPYVDNAISKNVLFVNPTTSAMTKYHLEAWKRQAKVSSYYTLSPNKETKPIEVGYCESCNA